MSSKHDFILKNMKFSFSSASTYKTCPYSFFLTYIESVKRVGNFYSSFGTYIHKIIEKYLKGELDIFDLAGYYDANYDAEVTEPAPPFPVGIGYKYRESGREFFENLSFDRDEYEVVFVEGKIDCEHNGFSVVVKPDAILMKKDTKDIILFDIKTSNPYTKSGKLDPEKLDGYMKQTKLYAHFWNLNNERKINKIALWFVRMDRIEMFDYENADDALEWFDSQVAELSDDEQWNPKTTNKFFCQTICSVRNDCEFWIRPEPRPESIDKTMEV